MIKKFQKKKGFVILFAVTISSILLSIALGVASVAFRELKFGTSARDSNDAFFAADTGAEYALVHDKSASSSYVPAPGTNQSWSFVVSGLGSLGSSCAKVTVSKDTTTNPPYTYSTIISKGYNVGDALCDSSSSNRVEREIKLNY